MPSVMIGSKTAPLPLLHGSITLTLGGVTYPNPLLTISIAMIVPFPSITGFPAAPIPPPPKKLIAGGPHGDGPTLHGFVLLKSRDVSALTSSIFKYFTSLSPLMKIKIVPGDNFS